MASVALRAQGWGPHVSPCTSTCLPEVPPQPWRPGWEAPVFALPSSLCLPQRTFSLSTCSLPPSALSHLPCSGCFLSSFPWSPSPTPQAVTGSPLAIALQASLHNSSVSLSHSSNPPNPFVVPPSPNSFLFFKLWLHKWKKKKGTWCVIECFHLFFWSVNIEELNTELFAHGTFHNWPSFLFHIRLSSRPFVYLSFKDAAGQLVNTNMTDPELQSTWVHALGQSEWPRS